MNKTSFSANAVSLSDSVTHGTRASVEVSNSELIAEEKIIDLSIGTLDMATDARIDQGVCEFICQNAETIHAFAPVKGFRFLRESIAAKMERLHKMHFDPDSEIIVTPGGIKGTLSVMFHTFLDFGDEVILPIPNWPHYADMLKLHGAIPKTILPQRSLQEGLTAAALEQAITPKTKLIILGDCINPTGKIYSWQELRSLAQVIANQNLLRIAQGESAIHVIFDCPYEAHILGMREKTFAAIDVKLLDGQICSMRDYTVTVTGPGKTYGMHGDRIGYALANKEIIEMAARVQVNLNSFASTYGQVATHIALQAGMDEVATCRARSARHGLNHIMQRLSDIPFLKIDYPDGGYFLFVDFSEYAHLYRQPYRQLGYESVDKFLLKEARVATICGSHFVHGAENVEYFRHFVRINCGRSIELLDEACNRIAQAIARLSEGELAFSLVENAAAFQQKQSLVAEVAQN